MHGVNPGADGVLGTADDQRGSPGVAWIQGNGALTPHAVHGFGPRVTTRRAVPSSRSMTSSSRVARFRMSSRSNGVTKLRSMRALISVVSWSALCSTCLMALTFSPTGAPFSKSSCRSLAEVVR